MKKLLLTLAFIFIAQVGFAQDAFKKDVVHFIEISGQAKVFEMLTKDLVKNVPAEKQAEFKKELAASIKDLVGKMADMYIGEFTHDEIKEAIKFYESPVGKKLSAKSDVLYEKGQAIGQEWGMGLQGMMMKYMQ